MTHLVPLAELVYDRRLQCRDGVDTELVAEYAAAIEAGDTFPDLEIVRVDGRHLVVDGWHRGKAHQVAGVEHVAAEVRDGTWRDAVLAAARANGQHGKRRSNEDKRRAVRLLLQDAEWAALSTRELGAMARVSHAFVGQVRRHYGLGRGEALTDDRVEEVDGELPARWAELGAYEPDLRALRAAQTLQAVGKASGFGTYRYGQAMQQAVTYRLEEIADSDADLDVKAARKADHQVDIEHCIACKACPADLRRELFEAWAAAHKAKRCTYEFELRELLGYVKGRKALRKAIADKLDAAAVESGSADRDQALALLELPPADLAKQLPAEAAGVLQQLARFGKFPDSARPALRQALTEHGVETIDCPDPRCAGVAPSQGGGGWSRGTDRNCWRCHHWPPGRESYIADVRQAAGELLLAGATIPVQLGPRHTVSVGELAVRALGALGYQAAHNWEELEAWLQDCPDGELKTRLYNLAGGEQLLLVDVPATPAAATA